MGSTVLLRSRFARALGATMAAFSAVALVSTALAGVGTLLDYGAPVALFGVLGWAAFWQPFVEVSDGGVTVGNTLRTVQVPWPAIESVDGRYGLRLRTAYGVVSAWGATAPSGRERMRDEPSESAALVQERLAALREAGHLEDRRLERDAALVSWNRAAVVSIGLLVLATGVLPLLG